MSVELGYVISYVDDVDASTGFYVDAFGLDVRFRHESGTYAELDTGTTVLAFADNGFAAAGNGIEHNRTTPAKPPPGVSITLITDDLAGAWKRAVGAGAVVIAEPEEKPWVQQVGHLRDIDGVLVELATPVG